MSTDDFPSDDAAEAAAEREALEAPDPVLEDDPEVVDLPELDLGEDLDDAVIVDDPEEEPTDVPLADAPLPPELA